MKETNIGQDNMAKHNQWLLLDLSLKMIIDGVTQPIQVDSVILKSILNKYMLKKLILISQHEKNLVIWQNMFTVIYLIIFIGFKILTYSISI